MRVNADFSRPVIVRPSEQIWHPSPVPGVERAMLDRIGGEVARATSIVRYAPRSSFTEHIHTGGEEFLVLSGSFHDSHGDYPAGTYVRNPIGTVHAPWAGPEGAEIFVKLHQFEAADTKQVRDVAFKPEELIKSTGQRSTRSLHEFRSEFVGIEVLPTGHRLDLEAGRSGHEILILSGSLKSDTASYPRRTWMRFPGTAKVLLEAGQDGTVFYRKSGCIPPSQSHRRLSAPEPF